MEIIRKICSQNSVALFKIKYTERTWIWLSDDLSMLETESTSLAKANLATWSILTR